MKLHPCLSSLLVASLLSSSAVAQSAPPPDAPTGGETYDQAVEDGARESASAHFKRGVQFYKARDFAAAHTAFKRAYELKPDYRVLFNLGQTSFELKDYVEALRAFETYLEEGGDEVSEERRADVQAELERLKNFVARVELTVNVDGAEVAVDDLVVGTTPLKEALLVNPGRRKITLRREGYAPLQRIIEAPGGEQTAVTLELNSLAVEPQPGVTIVREEPSAPVGFWTTFSLTLAFGAGTAVVGGLALAANADYDDALNTAPTTPDAIDDAASKVETFALVTDIFVGVTSALAVTTLVFGIVELGGDADEPGAEADPEVELGISPGGFAVTGRF